jgi:hypothetical protein
MRKILLATTALVGFAAAGAAQAATAPLNVTVGGNVDFVAATYHETGAGSNQNLDDFETLYALNFGVNGKTGSGVEYGGNLTLDNAPDIENAFLGAGNGLQVTTADIFLSGAFGKVLLGDSQGATDIAIAAPTVGEGQVTGRYIDFLNTFTFAKTFVAGIDGTDHSTNITYYTPKVGNDMNKVQAAVTFTPEFYNYGSSVIQTNQVRGTTTYSNANMNLLSPYRNVVKGAVAYTGTFKPVTLGLSADVINGSAKDIGSTTATNTPLWIVNAPAGAPQDFTSWGVGAQAAAEGFTLGGNFTNLGSYNTVSGQGRDQHTYAAALKYEFSKVGVGVSYLGGEGYDNLITGGTSAKNLNDNYVRDFDSYGVGGAYTWAPGLTTNLDGVLFQQKLENQNKNDGYVLLVSQKLAF